MCNSTIKTSACRFALMLLIIALPCTGCWGMQQVEETQFVTTLGMDLEPDGNILLTLHIIITERITSQVGSMSSGNSDSPGMAYYIASTKGKDIFDAFRAFGVKHSRRGDITHIGAMIIGEDLARAGTDHYLDWLVRNKEIRGTINIFLAEGKACDLMMIKPVQEKLSGSYLAGLTKVASAVAKSPSVTIKDFVVSFSTVGRDAILPLLHADELDPNEDEKGVPIRPSEEEERANMSISAGGMGAFRGGNLAGLLTEDETKGYFWLRNTKAIQSAIVTLPVGEAVASVEVLEISAKIKPEFDRNNRWVRNINVDIQVEGALREIQGGGIDITKSGVKLIERVLSDRIFDDASLTVRRSQELNSDFIGFGEIVKCRMSRKAWEELNWRHIFPEIPINITVSSVIRTTGVAFERVDVW